MQNLLLLLLFGSSLTLQCLAEDWSQWRGPNRNGKIESAIQFSESTQFKNVWTVQVGTGFSSCAILEDSLVTLGNAGDQDQVTCLNTKTGEIIWQKLYPAVLDPNLFEGGPTSTPAISAQRVYTLSRQGLVHCFNLQSGDQIWKFDIPNQLKYNIPTWGFAGSPLVVQDRVYLNAGSHGICLDANEGKLLWGSTNEIDAAYSSPMLVHSDSSPKLIMLNAKQVYAVSALTGKLLWSERWITRYGINAADPLILNQKQLLVSSGYGKGTGLIEFEADSAKLVWRNRDVRTQMSPGVLVAGAVYAIDGDEEGEPALVCYDPVDGKPFWREENFGTGSIIAVNSQLVALKASGKLVAFAADQQRFRPIREHTVSAGKCWSPPAISRRMILVRNAAGEVRCSSVQ